MLNKHLFAALYAERCQNMETRKKLWPSCKCRSWRRSEKSPTIPTLTAKRRRRKKKKTEEFATERLQVNPNKHPARWRSKHSRTNPGSSKEPSMTCHDKKVNFIPSSLFPLTWNSLQEALGNTPRPHVPSSISRQESPCVSLSSLTISLPRALLLALQRDFLAPLIYNFSLQEIYSFIFFFKR